MKATHIFSFDKDDFMKMLVREIARRVPDQFEIKAYTIDGVFPEGFFECRVTIESTDIPTPGPKDHYHG